MLNIISRSLVSKRTRGPKKVVTNLMLGLDQISCPYVVNRVLDASDTLWIHDDAEALYKAQTLSPSIAVIAGPNIFTVPRDIKKTTDLSRTLWLYPATWVENFWQQSGFQHNKTAVWPVGIDTDRFTPYQVKKKHVLVYVKQRKHADVQLITSYFDAQKISYKLLIYGSYQESEYHTLLKEASCLVWLGRSESQGIGFLEALSMNVPALVWDITHFGQFEGVGKGNFTESELSFSHATSIPYFDDRCGKSFTDPSTFPEVFADFYAHLNSFSPREYICENLTLAHQARSFIDLYSTHFGVSYESCCSTTTRSDEPWRNATLTFKALTYTKDHLRNLFT